MGADGERGVEQQHALTGPAAQAATGGDGGAGVVGHLLEDILERRGEGHAVGHGEAEALGLAGLVVGVLAEDDDLDAVEGAEVEGVEDGGGRGIAGALAILLMDKAG